MNRFESLHLCENHNSHPEITFLLIIINILEENRHKKLYLVKMSHRIACELGKEFQKNNFLNGNRFGNLV